MTFLGNDTIGMLMEELADASNYARYTFIRLALLADRVSGLDNAGEGHGIDLGPKAFQPTLGEE